MNVPADLATRIGDELAPAELVDRLTKYEAAIARLESARADYVRRTPLYRDAFAIMIAVGTGCFAFGVFPGLWGTICSTFISASGYGMLHVRIHELTREIDELRVEIERMHVSDGFAYRTA